MREPLVKVGETGILTVAAVTKIGIFADNGMPKQVLIPFREMLHTPEPGDQFLVVLTQRTLCQVRAVPAVLKNPCKDLLVEVGILETSCVVLSEGREVGDRIHQAQTQEPAVGDVHLDVLYSLAHAPDPKQALDELDLYQHHLFSGLVFFSGHHRAVSSLP